METADLAIDGIIAQAQELTDVEATMLGANWGRLGRETFGEAADVVAEALNMSERHDTVAMINEATVAGRWIARHPAARAGYRWTLMALAVADLVGKYPDLTAETVATLTRPWLAMIAAPKDYGTLVDFGTGDPIGPATRQQYIDSRHNMDHEEGPDEIEVDGRRAWVDAPL
jgi:hypothetical protein